MIYVESQKEGNEYNEHSKRKQSWQRNWEI